MGNIPSIRKHIDIINEFVSDPRDKEEGSNQTILISNISWDVSPEEEVNFPKRVTTTMHDVEEAADPYAEYDDDDTMAKIGDWLQSTYGGGLSNFEFKSI